MISDNDKFPQQEILSLNESDSLLSKVCDQFNFKDNVIKISRKTPIEVTGEFIDASILFIFLFIVFSDAGIVKLEYSFHMIVLSVVGISAVIEFIYVNTSLLKKYIGQDANTRRFLQKMPTLTPSKAKNEIKNLLFSSKCMNYFLHSVANEKNSYPPYIIESVITTQPLSKENLDLLFSPSVLKNILPHVVIDVLPKYRNYLTGEHVLNIYTQFKANDNILRILVATQSNSYLLLENLNDNSNIHSYYEAYQLNNKHLDWKLKFIPINMFRTIENGSFYLSTFFFLVSYFYGEKIPINIEPLELIGVIGSSIFLGFLFSYGLMGGILRRIKKYYYHHLVCNIIK